MEEIDNIIINQVDPTTFEYQQYIEQDNILISSSRLDTTFSSSIDYIEYYAYSGDEKGDKPHFYEKELELAERLLFRANEYKGVSEERIKYIRILTNGD